MTEQVSLLLQRRDQLVSDIARGRRLRGHLATMVAVMIGGSAIYGSVLGLWRSPLMSLYAAIKLPLLLIWTSILTMSFNWMVARTLSLRLSFLQVSVLATSALASAGLVLASLSPVAWLFTVCAPGASADARGTHNLLFVTHTALIAACGLVGSQTLWRTLRAVTTSRQEALGAYLVWLVTFAFVAGELGWLLRPFVGSIYFPVAFLRGDSLDRNVYEFIWTDILHGGGHES